MRTGNLDLMLGAAIKNFRPESRDTDPDVGTLVAAQTAVMWYNTTDKKYKYFDGTAIQELGAGGGSVEGAILADGTVPMTADLLLSGPDQSASGDNAAVSKKHVETVVAAKQDKITGLTENGVVVAGADNELSTSNVTATELGYLSGVTSNIQSQITALDGDVGAVQTALTGKLNATNGQLASDLDANNFTVANLAAPVNANDAARKIDIENAIAGIDWLHDSDAIQEDGTLDPELVAGKQYIILAADQINPNFGSITGLADNMIVRYSGTAFEIVFDPTNSEAGGAVTWVKAIKEYRRFDGTQWTTFGGASDFNAGSGLEKVGNVVNVKVGAGVQITDNAVTAKLDANGGLEDNAGSTRVKLDGATLARSVDGLAIADGGVGYAQIAAAALGAGLKQDAENSKIIVDAAALKTLGFIDATGGDVDHLNLTGTDPLTDTSAVSKKFVEDAIAASAGGSAAKLYVYDKTGAEDVADTAHTFTHNAGTKFGTVTVFDDTGYQIIPDEVVLIDANSLRVELTTAKKVAIAFVTGPKPNGSTDPEEPVEPEHFTVLVSSGNQATGINNGVYVFLKTDKADDIESITWSQTSTNGNINRVYASNCALVPVLDTTTLSNKIEAGSAGTVTATIKLKDVVEPVVRTAPYSFPEVPVYKTQVGLRTDAQWNSFTLKSGVIKAGETHSFALVAANSASSASGSDILTPANVIDKLGLESDDAVKSITWRLDAETIADRATTLVSTGVIAAGTVGYRANITMPNYPDSATSTGIRENYTLSIVFETTKGKIFIDAIQLAMSVAAGSGSTTPSTWTSEELTAA
ncbi:hypothetical protein D5P86_00995 [Salmonella enterica subsp. enterica serovar Infantis]|nr:hypothetical protein [Salmonella enterica subsp. enterica serovar Infantis]